MQNFNFTVFEDFYLSLSWKYRFLHNVNHDKVQSKTNKYCKFHVDLTRRRLSNSRFKKLGMVPKKLYRNTLSSENLIYLSICLGDHLLNTETSASPEHCVFFYKQPYICNSVFFALYEPKQMPRRLGVTRL